MAQQQTRLPRPFKLERFFAQYEFSTRYLACCSDCEPLALKELLAAADDDSLQRFDTLRLAYSESQGLPALREEISKLYDSVTPDDVVVCVPEEGVYLTMKSLLQPGQRVVVMFPAYQSLYELAQSVGCEVDLWEPHVADSGRLEFRVQDVLPLIKTGVQLVVVNFPHNPTGSMLPLGEWQQLIAACEAAGCYLFSDEMYRFTEVDEASRLPSGVDAYPSRAVSLCGLSKSWGLPGLRLGWVVCKDKTLREQILAQKDYTTICTAATSEVLALAAVRATRVLTQRCRDIIAANTDIAEGFFARWQHVFEWHRPQGGSIVYPRIKTGDDVAAWCKQVVAECGVLLLPASVYDHEPTAERGHLRIGLGRKDLPECLKQLDEWCVRKYGEPSA